MIKQGNLELSFRLALEELAKKDIQRQCQLAGATYKLTHSGKALIRLLLINEVYEICYPKGEVTCRGNSRPVNLMKKAIFLRYLNNAKEASTEEKLVGFNQLPAGSFYNPAFSQRVVKPFVTFFGEQPQKLKWAADKLGGVNIPFGDVGVRVPFLPKVSISFVLWKEDDEFSPNGKVLFNSNITSYLSTEGIIIASEMLFNRLKSITMKESKYGQN
ncbi:DUF3786 domain-containing protein [Candidatus Aerophobetes bacterium]|uniref:DUF3786 domain-containing protein n=1 Tax=Aerophobetes bacterium TaxID=2030807 RepID=A0A523TFT2_UNCAE|nr:MAG: DUF3786 domain-containing protein [Candidatus Aerophobetes bacterium]